MKQFGETDIQEFNFDTCCTIFRQLIQHVEKEMKEREKRLATKKVLLNSTKSSATKINSTNENLNKMPNNNFMDSLLTELKQRKFATVPANRPRQRPALFDRNNQPDN